MSLLIVVSAEYALRNARPPPIEALAIPALPTVNALTACEPSASVMSTFAHS